MTSSIRAGARTAAAAFALLAVTLLALALPDTLGAQAGPTHILALGDSITEGDPSHPSYRYALWTSLLDAGVDVDLVGSQVSAHEPPLPDHNGTTFDADHEGHSGWRADQVAAYLLAALQGMQVDVALLHLGTNDVLQGQSTVSTAEELGQVIDALRGATPDVTVLLAQIIPTGYSAYGQQVLDLNERIAALAAAKTTAASPVVVVDQHNGFDPAQDTYDGLHPNAQGEARMAARWRQTILALPGSPAVVAFSPAPGTSEVATGAAPAVTFDRPMSAASLESGALSVSAGGQAVTGQVTYDPDSWTATFTPAGPLPAGAEVIVTLAGGPSGAASEGGGPLPGSYTWSFTTAAVPPAEGWDYLSDLQPASVSNGWGPLEHDTNVGEQPAGDGGPIRLNGITYQRGLGSHSPADIRYALGGACQRFAASVGLDDAMNGTGGTVEFEVWTDGVLRYASGVMRHDSATQTIDLVLDGVQTLALIVREGGDNNWWDWADWADARVSCAGVPEPEPDTTPPAIREVTPSDGATGIPASAHPTVRFDEPVDPATLGGVTLAVDGGAEVSASAQYAPDTFTAALVSATPLEPETSYRVTVQGVTDTSGNLMSGAVTWTFTTAGPSVERYLSDLAWTSAANGWGPVELDTNVGEQPAGDGGPLTLNGVVYPRGLGVHANSDVRYALGGACTRFVSDVGLDDAMDETGGSIRFRVWTDGTLRFDSGVMWDYSATQTVDLDVTGVQDLVLVVTDGGNQVWWDWGDWAGARVTCAE